MSSAPPHIPSRPQPVVTAETRCFWDGARQGALRLRRCTACNRLAAPLTPRCADCLGDSFEVETMSGQVVFKARTVLHLAPLATHTGPLVIVECAVREDPRIVLIALDEAGATANAQPGAPLMLTFAQVSEGACFATVQLGVRPEAGK